MVSAIAPHVQGRVETFSQIAPLAGFFFSGGLNLDAKLFEHKKLSADQVRQLMQLILWKLESLRQWEKDRITGCIQAVVEHLELKLRDAMPLMFAAITGQASSVSVLDAMEILGPGSDPLPPAPGAGAARRYLEERGQGVGEAAGQHRLMPS